MIICDPVCDDVRLVPRVITVANGDDGRKSGGGEAGGDMRVVPPAVMFSCECESNHNTIHTSH